MIAVADRDYRPGKTSHAFLHADYPLEFTANSDQGTLQAVHLGLVWMDNDYHLTKDGIWVNAHGWPETVWLPKGKKFEDYTWANLPKKVHTYRGKKYHLRTGSHGLHFNAAHGRKTEIEVKDLRPLTRAKRRAALKRLAAVAEDAYGPTWQQHVLVKVLVTMGEAYALSVLQDAHDAGFPTMLLVRDGYVRKTYAGHTEITWLRGSKLKLKTTKFKPS